MARDALDELLASADPAETPGLAVASALSDLGERIVMHADSQPRVKHTRRRLLLRTAAILTIAGLGTGVAAAAGLFARTGRQASGVGEDGSGEIIRSDAPDSASVIAGIGDDIPLPPSVTIDQIASRFVT